MGLWGWFRRIFGGGKAHGESKSPDSPESNFGPIAYDNLNWDLLLTYTDTKGEQTERRVTLQRIHGQLGPRGGMEAAGHLIGHCHFRGETRTFHILGVDAIVDPATGERVTGLRKIERWLGSRARRRLKG